MDVQECNKKKPIKELDLPPDVPDISEGIGNVAV